MLNASRLKGYVQPDGRFLAVDADEKHLPLIRHLNPGFRIHTVPPPEQFVSARQLTLSHQVGLTISALSKLSDAELNEVLATVWATTDGDDGDATHFELIMEAARRLFIDCRLCGAHCGINRFEQAGRCGLGAEAHVSRVFTHIAEEPPLTPCYSIQLAQCGLRCLGCQAHEIVNVSASRLEREVKRLDELDWPSSVPGGAKTIQFTGGGVVESLYPVLRAIRRMPTALSELPLVWKSHGWESPEAIRLLDGVVDVHLIDMKGSSECLEDYARTKDYWQHAVQVLEAACAQRARVIVRLLMLPGHSQCCYPLVLNHLAKYRDRVWISLLDFYPDHKALSDPNLNRSTNVEERQLAEGLVQNLQLRDIETQGATFWS